MEAFLHSPQGVMVITRKSKKQLRSVFKGKGQFVSILQAHISLSHLKRQKGTGIGLAQRSVRKCV